MGAGNWLVWAVAGLAFLGPWVLLRRGRERGEREEREIRSRPAAAAAIPWLAVGVMVWLLAAWLRARWWHP